MIPKQPFTFHSGLWIRATTSDCRTIRTPNVCRTYGCSATTTRTPGCPCNTYSHMSNRVTRRTKIRVVGGMSTCRGRSVTRLTTYHISRHVASTFKRLATTTTHFNLKAFIKTDRVNFQVMIQHMTLSVILIVVAEL
jgi:hypothetical protein